MAGGAGDEVVEVSCGGGGGHPGAYAAVLKRKLDLYCAAVAKSMEARSQESSLGHPNSQASDTSQLISQASDTSQLISQASFDGDGDRGSIFINSHVIDNANCQGKPANSDTSKEQSDDDGDLEESTDPINAKKKRRMLSNRESARRSRKRKQTHLNDLESQVSRLTAENASLLKRLDDMTQKYKDAAFDNRNLRVDVGMMRRKVNIAEEAVRRVTGASMLLLPTKSDMPGRSRPMTSCASDAASAAVPIQESMQHLQHFLQASVQDDQIKLDLSNATFPLTGMDMSTRLAPLRRITSLENLQKRIRGDSVQSDTALPLLDPEALASDK
ncbi:hypothetical protein EJB05_57855 [Eragrostis curvula]|uniref:BZIP domain-containing protein n=1 Tax=Eragrostis curvula TaxID=38414 RepID=A0A5J9SCG7_9POAL|nr:hypothetical protein EJB05_57855 [Eragrostis curvula]